MQTQYELTELLFHSNIKSNIVQKFQYRILSMCVKWNNIMGISGWQSTALNKLNRDNKDKVAETN